MGLRKNIVSVTTDRDGNVTSETADYIGVEAFAKEIYDLYKECLDKYDDKDEFEQYINDLYGSEDYLNEQAHEFAIRTNEEMKRYLHMDNHRMDGNFANVKNDYTQYRAGTYWISDFEGSDEEYYGFFPDMVKRLDAAEDSERADDDREYLSSWFFFAFGTFDIKYNFSNDLQELHYSLEEGEVDEYVEG